jgi:hypothetical protein
MTWKLYVDSRKRIRGARGDTDADFAIRLPHPITVRDKFYIDVCIFSNSFHVIRLNENDKLYIDELVSREKRVVVLPPGQFNVYTLRDVIVSSLNAGRGISGQYAVAYQEVINVYVVHIVNPAATDQFRLWTDSALAASPNEWTSFAAPNALQTANRPCGFATGPVMYGDPDTVTYAPGAPDLQPYKQLFLRSSLGGGLNDCLGPNGENDIVRRLVVGNTPLNAVVYDTHSTALDFIAIQGAPEISTMWYTLTDVDGNVVDLHGHALSFSVIFQEAFSE